jgi:uncharacterized protein YuzE
VIAERREVVDPDGRVVVLDERTIGHLSRRRPQMVALLGAILDAVERPDLREDDPVPGRELFYRRDLDPSPMVEGSRRLQRNPGVRRDRLRPRSRAGVHAMKVTIAGTTFDQREYDERGDVLYLTTRPPQTATRTLATPEGHAVDYGETGAVIGMALVSARFFLERDGAVTVTIPPDRVVAAQVEPALVAA